MRVLIAIAAMLLLAGAPALPVHAQGNVFTWSTPADIRSMDPHVSATAIAETLTGAVYEGLVRETADNREEAALATRWEQVSPTRMRFHLRTGVTFHEGQPFTADDVVWSIARAKTATSDYRSLIANVGGAERVDDATVDVVTTNPDPLLLRSLRSVRIMSRRWAEEHDAAAPSAGDQPPNYAVIHANGTGPFRLTRREADTVTELEANPRWWDTPRHNIARLVFRPIANPATRVAALLTGAVDLIDPVPVQDLPRVQAAEGVHLVVGPEARLIYLGFDQHSDALPDSGVEGRNPLKDVRVRQAIQRAIDFEAIQTRLMRGQALPTALMVGPGTHGYDQALDVRPPYDVAAARALLAAAGYPDGFRLPMDCPSGRYVNDEAICQAVVAMLARVGIRVTLTTYPALVFITKVIRHESHFWLFGWLNPLGDAQHILQNVVASTGGFNSGGYGNPRVDALVQQLAVELDPERRLAMIREALQLHRDDVGHIPLHQQMLLWAHRDRVTVVQTQTDVLLLREFRVH
jgi:peptide/nickel transport system substrate-binding protein